MASSSTGICNSALRLIGVERISSLSEDSKQALLCNELYEETRDCLLRNFGWNFAIARANLAELATNPLYEWDHQFQLPSDCLRVLRVQDDVDFSVEGRLLLTNSSTVYLTYLKREEDVSKYDATFVKALSYRLAAELAYPLVQSASLAVAMGELADREIRESRGLDSQESSQSYAGDDYFINARDVGLYD